VSQYRYQVLLLDRRRRFCDVLRPIRTAMAARVADLGLPASTLRFLGPRGPVAYDPKAPVVAFYRASGSADPDEARLVRLQEDGVPIFPIARNLANFSRRVPRALRSTNGMTWSKEAASRERIVNRGLEELGLLRRQRIAFISYKRSEARDVAQQLFHRLVERSYDVFLDTFSIEGGVAFQPHLHDYLAGSDVLVLLDSPTALTSGWVEEEVTRAHQLGVLVFQVVWPAHPPTPGTELCARLLLQPQDMLPAHTPDSTVTLTSAAITRIVSEIESQRARAFAARRTRLVGEFVKVAAAAGRRVVVQSDSTLLLRRKDRKRTWVFPVVGHVSALNAHAVHRSPAQRAGRTVILYDRLGYLDDRQAHVAWLNDHLPVRCVSLDEVPAWVDR
jgi:hypothetical protein